MARYKLMRSAVAILVLLVVLAPTQAQGAPAAPGTSKESALLKALPRSRELWATIDVCSPSDQPDTVGIRGSMPGDRNPHDKMYMSFRLQYLDPATKQWLDLVMGTSPALVPVGPGGSVRQGGRSFQLVPKAGKPAFTMRGVVEYQWRRGGSVLQSSYRLTSAGHVSLAGADPARFSSASCLIG